MKYDPIKMVAKSRLRRLFENSDDDFRTHVLALMQVYINREPYYTDRQNYRHLCNIFTAIAFCAVLEHNGRERKESIQIVTDAMYEQIEAAHKRLRRLSRLPFSLPLVKQFLPLNTIFGNGWDVSYPVRGKEAFSITTHHCIYQEILTRYQIPELLPVFCQTERMLFKNLPGADFHYTYQIGTGGPFYDYTFRVKSSDRYAGTADEQPGRS